jgi:hypothetical protein
MNTHGCMEKMSTPIGIVGRCKEGEHARHAKSSTSTVSYEHEMWRVTRRCGTYAIGVVLTLTRCNPIPVSRLLNFVRSELNFHWKMPAVIASTLTRVWPSTTVVVLALYKPAAVPVGYLNFSSNRQFSPNLPSQHRILIDLIDRPLSVVCQEKPHTLHQ